MWAVAALLLLQAPAWLVGLRDRGLAFYPGDTMDVGGRVFAISPDRRYVYAVADSLAIIDVGAKRRVADIPINLTADAIAAGGLIAVAGAGQLVLVDPDKRAVVRKVDTQGKGPHAVTFGGRIYVSNSGSGTVLDVDPNNGRAAVIRTGGTPGASVLSRDGKQLFVANAGAGGITIVDTARKLASAHISTCSSPAGIVLMAGRNQLAYICRGEKRIAFADPTKRAQVDYVLIPDETVSLSVTSDGKSAAACAPEAGLVYIINVEQKRIVDRLPAVSPVAAFPLQ
jgi:YVTN family beta-propeller protein